jgi:GNAT acetyltransferase-like protein
MVLVTAARRRARLGTRLLETCCDTLVRRHLTPLLDATPAGERVYRPLGFEPLFKLTRLQGDGGGAPRSDIRAMTESDLPAAAALDAAAFGADRMFLLESFFRRAPHGAFVSRNGTGFVMARPGRLATQVGPLVAADEGEAAALIEAALGAISGPVFLDLADRWDKLGRLLHQRGFTVQRPFLRMALRRRIPYGDPGRLFVIAGPEFG